MILQERFDAKYEIVEPGGCWVWMGCLHSTEYGKGYGSIRVNGRNRLAHRVSWELHHGSIPTSAGYHGTCVLHRCDNPLCVRPDHLFLGKQVDNILDRDTKGRGRSITKFTDAKVASVRALGGTMSTRKIAKRLGISKSHVFALLNDKYRGVSQ